MVRLIITLILLRLRIILLRDRLICISRLPWIASLIRILIGWWRSSIWINHAWWRKSASCHSTFKLYGNEFSILLNIKLMISSCEKWNDDNKSQTKDNYFLHPLSHLLNNLLSLLIRQIIIHVSILIWIICPLFCFATHSS